MSIATNAGLSGSHNTEERVRALKLPKTMLLVGGTWQKGETSFEVTDKFTGRPIATVSKPSRQQVRDALAEARDAFQTAATPPLERARILKLTAKLLQERRTSFANLIVAEVGFTLSDANAEIDRAIVTLELCGEEATRLVGETVSFAASPGQHERIGFTLRVPLGIVCAITPFNAPLNTVVHKIAPAIAGGNAVVLKPSAATPLVASLLCEALLDAGMEPRMLTLLQGGGADVGAWLLEEQSIDFYSFTGSTRVGRAIGHAAGLRRCQLELGSIASTIVCADADLDRAIPKIISSSFRKAGQVCTSIQRLFVAEPIFSDFVARLAASVGALKTGDPADASTQVGPMISEAAAKRAESWIDEARSAGARVLVGGTRSGPLLSPTIIVDAKKGMRVIDEEIFAPVVCVLPFVEVDQAFAGANDSPYGLAAGIFTTDVNVALRAAHKLRFGAVHINETSSSRGDAMPFGGVKDSGFGHEGPYYAIREVTEERLITLNP